MDGIRGDTVDSRLALRCKSLRTQRGWTLEELSRRSGVSRATLSRIENAEVSPTATVLGRLAASYSLTVSRLMRMVEDAFQPLYRLAEQPIWIDPETGYRRRSVSPPAHTLSGEVIEAELPPGTCITYDRPPRPGLEHHLLLREGSLTLTVDGQTRTLRPGDCLRYQLIGASRFETPKDQGARYLLFVV